MTTVDIPPVGGEVATAEVIPLREQSANAHPWTPLIREAREEKGLRSNREIAEWVATMLDWFSLTDQEKVALLVHVVARRPGGERRESSARHSFDVSMDDVDGSTESVMRLAAAGSIWDQEWAEVGYKQTRDLTVEDVDTLEMAYKLNAARNLIRSKWFAALRDLMRKHKVNVAGVLEDKGVALPPVTLKVEAGE